MRQLFRELKRRDGYEVAATYAAVALVTRQAVRLIFPALPPEAAPGRAPAGPRGRLARPAVR